MEQTIYEWLNENATIESGRLMEATRSSQGQISGYGLKTRVKDLIHLLQSALYPLVFYEGDLKTQNPQHVVERCYRKAAVLLLGMASDVLPACRPQAKEESCQCEAKAITEAFFKRLPDVALLLDKDITAAFEGDPAAKSKEEVMLAYPAFEAISIYRLAHELEILDLPMIPRMMSEVAHSETGIDIHPGAVIGEYFFIDHGTGVVIGETCHIGSHVKLYQSVTLGAKSFALDENGHPVKGGKRHPDVGDNVVIYAGATILGGDVKIGSNCVIGGGVWLTHSVPPDTIVYNTAKSVSAATPLKAGEDKEI